MNRERVYSPEVDEWAFRGRPYVFVQGVAAANKEEGDSSWWQLVASLALGPIINPILSLMLSRTHFDSCLFLYSACLPLHSEDCFEETPLAHRFQQSWTGECRTKIEYSHSSKTLTTNPLQRRTLAEAASAGQVLRHSQIST